MDGLSECRFFIRKRMKDKSESYTYTSKDNAFAEAHKTFLQVVGVNDKHSITLANIAWGVEIDGVKTIIENFNI